MPCRWDRCVCKPMSVCAAGTTALPNMSTERLTTASSSIAPCLADMLLHFACCQRLLPPSGAQASSTEHAVAINNIEVASEYIQKLRQELDGHAGGQLTELRRSRPPVQCDHASDLACCQCSAFSSISGQLLPADAVRSHDQGIT
jgi:hypothetical protein